MKIQNMLIIDSSVDVYLNSWHANIALIDINLGSSKKSYSLL